MAQFVIVIVIDLTKITCYQIMSVFMIVFILISLTKLGYIDYGGQGRVFLALLIFLLILATVFLLFSPSFINSSIKLFKCYEIIDGFGL